jgi:hypothetical protein
MAAAEKCILNVLVEVVKVVKVKVDWVIEKIVLLSKNVVNVLFAQQIIDDVEQNEEFERELIKRSLYISRAAEAQCGMPRALAAQHIRRNTRNKGRPT